MTAFTPRCTEASSVTPIWSMAKGVGPVDGLREVPQSRNPRSARWRAQARPVPEETPVMRTTRVSIWITVSLAAIRPHSYGFDTLVSGQSED